MHMFRKSVIAIVAVATLGIIGSLMNSPHAVIQGAGGGPTVTIDPAQLPLSVTGSTTVAGTVAATQAGPWTIGVRDSEARQPYVAEASSPNLPAGNECSVGGYCAVHFPAIPAGKRLVISYVSVRHVGANNKMFAASLVVPGAQIFLPTPQIVPPNASLLGYWSIISQAVHLTVEPGASLQVIAQANAYTPGDGVVVGITGYMVDVP